MSGAIEGPVGQSDEGRAPRWSARGKQEVSLRLLRGEGLDALARETGQAAGVIAGWREEFLAAGQEGLEARPAPTENRRLADAQRKIGELSMKLDIARALLEEVGRRPGSAEALNVQHGWRPRWRASVASRGSPGRRRASSAADPASRSRWSLQPRVGAPARWAP